MPKTGFMTWVGGGCIFHAFKFRKEIKMAALSGGGDPPSRVMGLLLFAGASSRLHCAKLFATQNGLLLFARAIVGLIAQNYSQHKKVY